MWRHLANTNESEQSYLYAVQWTILSALSLIVGGSGPPSNEFFLPTEVFTPNKISIHSTVSVRHKPVTQTPRYWKIHYNWPHQMQSMRSPNDHFGRNQLQSWLSASLTLYSLSIMTTDARLCLKTSNIDATTRVPNWWHQVHDLYASSLNL